MPPHAKGLDSKLTSLGLGQQRRPFCGDDSLSDTGSVLLQPIPSADGDADDIADASTLERADKRLANLAAVRAALCSSCPARMWAVPARMYSTFAAAVGTVAL